eukprot:scaffold24022_cov168-Amphora_coffeaeformis.AAC.3
MTKHWVCEWIPCLPTANLVFVKTKQNINCKTYLIDGSQCPEDRSESMRKYGNFHHTDDTDHRQENGIKQDHSFRGINSHEE